MHQNLSAPYRLRRPWLNPARPWDTGKVHHNLRKHSACATLRAARRAPRAAQSRSFLRTRQGASETVRFPARATLRAARRAPRAPPSHAFLRARRGVSEPWETPYMHHTQRRTERAARGSTPRVPENPARCARTFGNARHASRSAPHGAPQTCAFLRTQRGASEPWETPCMHRPPSRTARAARASILRIPENPARCIRTL